MHTTRRVQTMCPMNCHPTLCGMRATVADGALVAIEGDPDNPDSRGFLCMRGHAAQEIVGNPRRLTRPLIRPRRGADLVEVSPPFDPTGATAFLGVSVMFELLCAMVST